MTNLLQLKLAVLASVDGAQSIDAFVFERAAHLLALPEAVAGLVVVVWGQGFEGAFFADGGHGADGHEEEILVEDKVAAGTGVEGGCSDESGEGDEGKDGCRTTHGWLFVRLVLFFSGGFGGCGFLVWLCLIWERMDCGWIGGGWYVGIFFFELLVPLFRDENNGERTMLGNTCIHGLYAVCLSA